jgi:hypothetical protein
MLVDIYEPSQFEGTRRRANRYSRTCPDQAGGPQGGPCTVGETGLGIYKIISYTNMPPQITRPETFMDVLREWGCTWMWEGMRLTGDDSWLEEAILDDSLVVVTDGSYMRDKFPTMNSCTFILECTKGRGRLTGAFPEQTIVACSYRGELIGLLAIHLILLSVSRVAPELTGSAHIYSDCLGALDKVKNLPPHCMLLKCRHLNVLKNITWYSAVIYLSQDSSHTSRHTRTTEPNLRI